MKKFTGTGIALITPFQSDNTIDFLALEKLVSEQIQAGVDYLVVMGTTSEVATLSLQEQKEIQKKIISFAKNKIPLVLGLSGNNTSQLIENIKNTNLSDFDAILSATPSYNKPTQDGIFQHFSELAKICEKPIILYNVPSRTGVNLSPKTVLKLANHSKKFIGIKEAAGDMVQALFLKKLLPKDFLIISGDDMLALPIVLSGGAGVISVLGQAYPKEFSKMIALGLAGKNKAAYKYHDTFMDLIRSIFQEGNPSGIKSLLQIQGKIKNRNVRLPLVAATEQLYEQIKSQNSFFIKENLTFKNIF